MRMNLIYVHFTYINKNIIITVELYRVMERKKHKQVLLFFFCRYVVREVNTEGRK